MFERRRGVAPAALVISGLLLLAACGGGGGGGSKAVRSAAGGAITVEARDLSFDVGTIDASPGPLRVTLVNHGAVYHTLKVEGTSFELTANAGQTKTGTVTLAKGTYTFECTVPGHASAGMKGKIVVA